MTKTYKCKNCRRILNPNPRIKNQQFCNRKECQRARKTAWQRNKMAIDVDYRENQKNSQRNWRENNRTYWQLYRESNPAYCQRNRLLQKNRDIKRHARHLAKMDALNRLKPITQGSYYLIPATENLAKMDALMQKVSVIPDCCMESTVSCKKGLDRSSDDIEIQGENRGGTL
jgi:hypothetical protein